MKCNVGGADRTLRLVVGAVLLGVGLFVEMGEGLRIVSFVGAAIALLTATVRYCPANAIFGFNSCHKGT